MLSDLAPGTTIADMKSDVLSALQADVSSNSLDFMAMDPPQISVESEDDFELCRAIRERGKPTGDFEVLEPSKLLKDNGLSGWEAIFLQFRDRSSGKHIFTVTLRGETVAYSFHCFAFVDTTLKLLWASPNLMHPTYRRSFTNHIHSPTHVRRRR